MRLFCAKTLRDGEGALKKRMVKGGKKQACATIHEECKFSTKKLRALKRPVLSHKVDLIKQGCENNVVKQMSKS